MFKRRAKFGRQSSVGHKDHSDHRKKPSIAGSAPVAVAVGPAKERHFVHCGAIGKRNATTAL